MHIEKKILRNGPLKKLVKSRPLQKIVCFYMYSVKRKLVVQISAKLKINYLYDVMAYIIRLHLL